MMGPWAPQPSSHCAWHEACVILLSARKEEMDARHLKGTKHRREDSSCAPRGSQTRERTARSARLTARDDGSTTSAVTEVTGKEVKKKRKNESTGQEGWGIALRPSSIWSLSGNQPVYGRGPLRPYRGGRGQCRPWIAGRGRWSCPLHPRRSRWSCPRRGTLRQGWRP